VILDHIMQYVLILVYVILCMKKSTNYQLALANRIVFQENIKKVNKDHYQIKSQSNKNQVYNLTRSDLSTQKFECECKSFIHRKWCSHLAALNLFIMGPRS